MGETTKRAPPQKLTTTALPPRPDASILLGEDRYGEEDVFADLLAYGRVVGPREEAAAAAGRMGRWELAWRGAPMVICDTGLLEAIGALAPDLIDVSGSVIIAAIGKLLEEHPGPVGCLRLECPHCTSPHVIVGWMNQLRATRGEEGLHELTVINNNQAKNREDSQAKNREDRQPAQEPEDSQPKDKNDCLLYFPLQRLPRGLRRLSLCNFDLRPLPLYHHFTGVEDLMRLVRCHFSGRALSNVISELYVLRTLVLGSCHLTRGTGAEEFSIVSTYLLRFEMWSCRASREVSLQYTPRLQVLWADVLPQNRDAKIHLNLRTPNALREIQGLKMYCHELSYITPVNAKFKGDRIAPLLNLSILSVYIQMSTPLQTLELLKLLVHIPCLRCLTIVRVDNTHVLEEFTGGQDSFGALCITSYLTDLILDQFRAGPAELTFTTSMLSAAAQLTSLRLKPHATLSPMKADDACILFNACPHASVDCKIVFD